MGFIREGSGIIDTQNTLCSSHLTCILPGLESDGQFLHLQSSLFEYFPAQHLVHFFSAVPIFSFTQPGSQATQCWLPPTSEPL